MTAANEHTLNLFVVRGTAFSLEGGNSARVLMTESPSLFKNRVELGKGLACICVGPEWLRNIESTIALVQSLPVTCTALIPRHEAELAHLMGLLGMSKIVEYRPSDSLDQTLMDKLFEGPSFVLPSLRQAIKNDRYQSVGKKTIVFSDPKSKAMLSLVQRVATVEVTTLLSGPSGVGKEVIARILHGASMRGDKPFVPLNCSAIPEQLVESILFGHMKGSFTGAVKDQVGVFEEAHGGTLFLDEVGELPLHIQPKLLRALQERKIVKVGSSKERSFDVRLVAATNKDLSSMVTDGSFREDLFYRLNAFHIGIPPLSDRPLDIKELAIKLAASQDVAGIQMDVTEAAVERLMQHSWPGNVRELENVICRAKVLAVDGLIDTHHILFDAVNFLGPSLRSERDARYEPSDLSDKQTHEAISDTESDGLMLNEARRTAELELIESAIRETASKKEAAKRLGISPRTLRHKLQKLRQSDNQSTYEFKSAGVT